MNLKYKSNLKKRILASLLDYALILISSYLYIMIFGHANEEGATEVKGMQTLPLFLAWFIYFVVIESIYGATLGHQGFNLKVLTLRRKEISFSQALRRHLLDPIDILCYGIPAFIAIHTTDKHQRLGDLWAETIVVDMTDSEQYVEKGERKDAEVLI
jgi:uncharacterized RDD family membrane protein YckC